MVKIQQSEPETLREYMVDFDYIAPKSSSNKVVTEKYLKDNYPFEKTKSDNIVKSTSNYIKKYYKPSRNCMSNYFFDRFPIINWMMHYNLKENLSKDLITGLTIGIVQIPQSMAYSIMAGLPAVNGLYASFFSMIMYAIFGTSRHFSAGTYAVVSIMVKTSVLSIKAKLNSNTTSMNSTDDSDLDTNIAMTLALSSGFIQILLAILHVGFIAKYISDAIVNGFTMGAAMIVIISQIPSLLGIKIGDNQTVFFAIEQIVRIFENITKTNIATLVVSIVAIIFLYIMKTFVNEKYKDKLPMPLPVELTVVIVGTLVFSDLTDLKKYGVSVVGDIKKGMPDPRVPPDSILFKVLTENFSDFIPIAIVSFIINISMCKLFAKKHNYEIKPNQELFAYGTGNLVGSFFGGFPGCVSLSRCAIVNGIGAKTQVYGIVASLILLAVILVLGPYFSTLPKACLASIIVVSLRAMAMEVIQFRELFRKNKTEALGTLATFLGVMVLNVDYGLYIGIVFSILLVVIKSQRPNASVLGVIPGTNIFENIDVCKEAKEIDYIRIIRYEESLYYANVENFKYKIIKLCKINPTDEISKKQITKSIPLPGREKEKIDEKNDEKNNPIQSIIIDCSCMNYIDSQGVSTLLMLYESYKKIGIMLVMSYCKQTIVKRFKKLSFDEKFDFNLIFATTNDAVHYINELKIKKETIPNGSENSKSIQIHTSLKQH